MMPLNIEHIRQQIAENERYTFTRRYPIDEYDDLFLTNYWTDFKERTQRLFLNEMLGLGKFKIKEEPEPQDHPEILDLLEEP